MNKPEKPAPLTYKTKYGVILVLSDPRQFITYKGRLCIDGGEVVVNGKKGRLIVAYDDKPELAKEVKAWKEAWDKWAQEFDEWYYRNIPGLVELRKAIGAATEEEERFEKELAAMFDGGSSIYPRPVDKSLREKANALAKKYPRAAMYLRAEGYTLAANYHKAAAGEKAKQMLLDGEPLDKVEDVLDHWLPESAMWD